MNYNNLPRELEHRIFERWLKMIEEKYSPDHYDLFVSAKIEVEKWYKEQEKLYPGMVHFEE